MDGSSVARCADKAPYPPLPPRRQPTGAFVTVNLFREDGLSSTPPESPLSPTKATTARFVFDVTGVYDPLPFECNLDAGGWQDCSSPVQVDGPLVDGIHAFEVRVAGNPATKHEWSIGRRRRDAPATRCPPFLLIERAASSLFLSARRDGHGGTDTVAPSLAFVAPPSTLLPSGSQPSVSINASETVKFECASPTFFGDDGFHSCSDEGVTRVILTTPEPLDDGRYFLAVRAFDAAKNGADVITLEWTVGG